MSNVIWLGQQMDEMLLEAARNAISVQDPVTRQASMSAIQAQALRSGRQVNFQRMEIEYI